MIGSLLLSFRGCRFFLCLQELVNNGVVCGLILWLQDILVFKLTCMGKVTLHIPAKEIVGFRPKVTLFSNHDFVHENEDFDT